MGLALRWSVWPDGLDGWAQSGGVADMCCLTLTAVKVAAYAAKYGELVRANPESAGADVPVTLPVPKAGKVVAVALVNGWGSGYAVVVSSVSGGVGDAATQTLRSVGEVLTLIGDGTDWKVMEWYFPPARPNPSYVLGSGGPSSVVGLKPGP